MLSVHRTPQTIREAIGFSTSEAADCREDPVTEL
jgi:hypothetical protein